MSLRLHRPPGAGLFDELVVDNFAGGGGASLGIERALGRAVDIAVNHDPTAVALHAVNHPHTRHLCESVWDVDPVEVTGGRPVGLAWFSPDCKHFSKAKGGKPVEKRIRGLAWVVVRWAARVRPRVIALENVEEFTTWGPLTRSRRPCPRRRGLTFQRWVLHLERLGYAVEHRELVAADYGAPTTRKRLFLIARCDGRPIVWPEPTHGRSRPLPWRTAAECIDWSVPCPSIFGRRRPLADATLRRIAAGIRRYVLEAAEPFIVTLRGTDESHVEASSRGCDEPLRTVSASGWHHGLVAPTLVQTSYGERQGQRPRYLDIHQPLGTVVAGGAKHALVAAFLAKHYGGVVGQELDRPIGTVTAQDHHSLAAVAVVKHNHGAKPCSGAREPLHTVTTQGNRFAAVAAFLTKYYGTGAVGQDALDPLGTATARARFGLVAVAGEEYRIADIGMRMLQPRELFRAQGFPDSYCIEQDREGRPITKTAQIRMAGNSVCPPLAEAIVRANTRELARAEAHSA